MSEEEDQGIGFTCSICGGQFAAGYKLKDDNGDKMLCPKCKKIIFDGTHFKEV